MVDLSETEVGHGRHVVDNIFAETRRTLEPCVVVVSGPDQEGEICILGGAETYLPPDVAKALAEEILRRIKGVLPS